MLPLLLARLLHKTYRNCTIIAHSSTNTVDLYASILPQTTRFNTRREYSSLATASAQQCNSCYVWAACARVMLSGEGNAGERWKSNFARAAHFFLYISLLLFCTTKTWNFQRLVNCTFYGGNVRFLVHFFSLPPIFTLHWWPLAFLILLSPLQNFHVVVPTKKYLLCFLSLALDLSRPFSRWASLAAAYFFSVFLLLYIPNLWTWQLI